MLKIAVLSLADINNYGDVFFPVVVKNELLKRMPEAEIEIITNVKYTCELYGTVPYTREYLKKFDAIVYGGGELISPFDDETIRAIYGEDYCGTPSNIAYEWLDLEKVLKVWFGVGAHPVLFDYPEHVDTALENLDYLCVRGTISKKVLEKGYADNNGSIRVIPDLGWLFPRYIDEYDVPVGLPERQVEEKQPYMVFEAVDDLDIEKHIISIAEQLVLFQKTSGVKVLLLPIIQTKGQWFERKVLEKIYTAAAGELTLLPDGLSILQIGTILKNARFFVGSSLHGAVTMLSYGKPAVNIRSSIHTKLQDVHAARYRATCFANGWDVLPGVLERLNRESQNDTDRKYALMYAEYMRYRLGREFDNLAAVIRQHGKQA